MKAEPEILQDCIFALAFLGELFLVLQRSGKGSRYFFRYGGLTAAHLMQRGARARESKGKGEDEGGGCVCVFCVSVQTCG